MPEKVIVSQDHSIIEVRSYGDVRKEDLFSSLFEVEELIRETGITRILVDTIDVTSMPSIFKLYEFAADIPRKTKFAILAQATQPTMSDVHFVETVARNRGLRVQIFNSRGDALSWLMR